MNRDDIKEFLELAAGLKKTSRMLAEAEGDEEEGEEEGEGEEDKEGEDEDKEEVKVSKDEEIELSKSLDDSLNALFVDIETDALKSAAVQKKESYSLRAALLKEAESSDLDIEKFSAETARIIKNADVLLDIQDIIMSKARDYLLSKYDEDAEASFLEIMKTRFHIDHRDDHEKEQSQRELPTPIAVGAGGGGDAG